MLFGGLAGLSLPLLPAQILWINLLTHGLVGVAFGAEPVDPREMTGPPRPPWESVFPRPALVQLLGTTVVLTATALAVASLTDGADALRRTAVFLALGGAQLGVAVALRSVRSRTTRLRERGVEASVLVAMLLLLLAVYAPPLHVLLGTTSLPASDALLALGAAVVPGVALALWRRWLARRSDAPQPARPTA
jgi:Ca2+-transporting ATPase